VLRHVPREQLEDIPQKEEENSYRVLIYQEPKTVQQDPPAQGQKPVVSEDETTAEPIGHRYTILESIEEAAEQDLDSDHETWYPADIDPHAPNQNIENEPESPQDGTSNQNGAGPSDIKDKEPIANEPEESVEEPKLRVSNRKNKG
jgi:hypothetical protein